MGTRTGGGDKEAARLGGKMGGSRKGRGQSGKQSKLTSNRK